MCLLIRMVCGLGLGFRLRGRETVALHSAMATETLHPGRRIVLSLPRGDHEAVTIAVLDAPTQPHGHAHAISCAAMLVPAGAEGDWLYTSEGGQWQLLAAAAVSRLIIVERSNPSDPPESTAHGFSESGAHGRVKGFGFEGGCLRCEDEVLKLRLRSIVVALAPRVCFRSGLPDVPFVVYSDNVIHRVVVEELYSSLTGFMMVEDVALDDSDAEVPESERREGETECSHRSDEKLGRKLDGVSYRRRLRFKRMPNLIQTEVPLVMPQKLGNSRVASASAGVAKRSVGAFRGEVMNGLQIDHSWLVHKYLPPIVAGLVLAASCIEPCMERGEKPKVLTLGVGGGALPIFLQKHLGFRVQAVDADEVVLDAARRHFGLENGIDMEVIAGDALQFVDKLAMTVRAENATLNPSSPTSENLTAPPPECRNSTNSPNTSAAEDEDVLAQPCSTQSPAAPSSSPVNLCPGSESKHRFDSHRVHAIIVDVDEGDPRCALSSPPSSFLEHKFLTAARAVLHEGGMLAMNVVPSGATAYHGVVSSLFSVFDHVYETAVEGDVNRVVFALSFKGASASVDLDGPLARLVKRFLDVQLISAIQRLVVEFERLYWLLAYFRCRRPENGRWVSCNDISSINYFCYQTTSFCRLKKLLKVL